MKTKVRLDNKDFALVVRNVGDPEAKGHQVSIVFPEMNPEDQVSGLLATLTTIAICLDKQDPEFLELVSKKFNELAADSKQLKVVNGGKK